MDRRERVVAAAVAREVRRVRDQRGWSQAALAEKLGLSVNYVSLIERAERLPSVEVLVRLATTLGTTTGALVGEVPSDADPWLREATGILKTLPAEARPMMIGMLRGAADAPLSAVRPKRRRA